MKLVIRIVQQDKIKYGITSSGYQPTQSFRIEVESGSLPDSLQDWILKQPCLPHIPSKKGRLGDCIDEIPDYRGNSPIPALIERIAVADKETEGGPIGGRSNCGIYISVAARYRITLQ